MSNGERSIALDGSDTNFQRLNRFIPANVESTRLLERHASAIERKHYVEFVGFLGKMRTPRRLVQNEKLHCSITRTRFAKPIRK